MKCKVSFSMLKRVSFLIYILICSYCPDPMKMEVVVIRENYRGVTYYSSDGDFPREKSSF